MSSDNTFHTKIIDNVAEQDERKVDLSGAMHHLRQLNIGSNKPMTLKQDEKNDIAQSVEEKPMTLHPVADIIRDHLLSEIEAENLVLGSKEEAANKAIDFYGEKDRTFL